MVDDVRPEKTKIVDGVTVHAPPSEQFCQGPVPKPGEPIEWTKGWLSPGPNPPPAKPAVVVKRKKTVETVVVKPPQPAPAPAFATTRRAK